MATPRFASRVPRDVDITAPQEGARLLGLPLLPQTVRLVRMLEARRGTGVRYPTAVVQMPRRSTKTTGVWATILGRAATRPGYRCVVTAQSGTTASRILLEHAEMMLRAGTAVESRQARTGSHLPVLFRNGGREHLDFANGSRIWVVPPEAGAVRSAASDDIVIDEAGEFEGEKGKDFLLGVLPLMDTRGPLAQLVISGTPGKVREGMFWDQLEEARAGDDPEVGILDYSARDDDDPEDRKVWRRVHPGPASGLTPMKVLERRFKKLGALGFAREYLCVWPADSQTGALDVDAWEAQGVDGPPARPPVGAWVLAFDASKEGTHAAVVAAWKDGDGRAWFEVLAMRAGTSWVAAEVHRIASASRAHVVFDEIGANVAIAAELRRARPTVRVEALTLKQVSGAAQLLATEVKERRVGHYRQPDLDVAVGAAGWRPAGRDGRAFGARPGRGAISPVVAASFALWHYNEVTPGAREPMRIRTSA